MRQALQGIRVLEVGSAVAVRYLGRLFAVFGAEVLRTAPPGDDHMIGFAGPAGEAFGRWLDAGKLIHDEPIAPFDLIVGGLDASDLVEAERRQRQLGGVLAALRWFDPEGPYGGWSATDEIIAALSGLAFSFGEADGPPMLAQGHIPQVTAGVTAFSAALAALLTPRGRRPTRLDVNVLEAAMCYSETAALTGARTGTPSVRLGVNRFVPTYPCAPYQARDGWVGVTCLTPAQWGALCNLLGRGDLAGDSRFATAYERLTRAAEVDQAIAPSFAARTQAEWVALGIIHRIPIAPMVQPGRLPQVEHWAARGAFGEFGLAGVQGPTTPYRMTFDGVTVPPWKPAGAAGPLDGLRVVDFSMGWAGPMCARLLGDLGADVVKVESQARPDWWRGWESGSVDVATLEAQLNFINVNRNKRGVDVDLTTPGGLEQARGLIARADVVVENYAAGVLAKLGLGQELQRELRPGLISLSMPAFGNGGPLSGLRAYGSTVEQASGLPFINGQTHWVPAQQHIALGDPIAGIYAASAVLVALYARDRLGGADIDLAQVACLFQLGADAIIAEQVLDAPVERSGHFRGRLALCTVVAAAEAETWLAVVAADAAALKRLQALTGGAGLAPWARRRSARVAAEALQAIGIAAGPVQPPHLLCQDTHLQAVGFFPHMEREYVGRHQVAAAPFRFDGQRPSLRRPAPLLGQHSAEVLGERAVAVPSRPEAEGGS